MKSPNPWVWTGVNPHHDKAVENLAENNCLLITGICFFLDRVRHIYDLDHANK
jgi:hypothetical protein